MDSANSAASGVSLALTSPQLWAEALVIVIAVGVALAIARTTRARRARAAAAGQAPDWLERLAEVIVMLAPMLAALAVLLIGHATLAASGRSSALLDGAAQLAAAVVLVRLGVYILGRLLGPGSWLQSREGGITLVLSVIVALALLGWLDAIESVLNRINVVPGKSQFSLWALLKGLVVVTAFVVVTSLVARAIERHVMQLEQLAVSTRVGVSKFSYFLLVGLGVLLGINAAGVEVTTLNVLTGAIGLGLGFGLQSVASNFVSGFVLLMDKSIKPGDVISFTAHDGSSTGNFGWVQELRGRYVVVRDRDGVDTLVPNQNLISNPFINWSYSDQRVRIKLPVAVSYEDDPELALKLLVEATENHPRILRDPQPVSRLISFDDSGIRLEIRFWIADPVNGVNNVRSDVNRAIWRIFRAHGVTIPFPQREVRIIQGRAPRPPASPGAEPTPGQDRAAD
ncbi:MAG TPA: mechanosensitive ion channel domain-containing protein [Steroidobacteraceae bacterium]|nr:mechanosensitive ion channel domain-containing protein [Steroidobacteraceae bacterium]